MVRFFLFFCIISLLLNFGCESKETSKFIPDGIYLVKKIDTIKTRLSPLLINEKAIFFNKMFDEYNDQNYNRIIIDTTQYVQLDLEGDPKAEQDAESKKRLLLSLSKNASASLKIFSIKYLMKKVVLVIDGEALTIHKIKEPLTSGLLQITRCNDNACEKLSLVLKDNFKND